MPKPRKRLAGAAGPTGPDNKGPAGKRTKTKNPVGTSATLGNSSPEKTSASKNCGKNLSSYWLMKSEPESRLEKGVDVKFSIEDLKAQPKQTACWDGVRNYQARNFLRAMQLGQEAFFYHSNCKEPGIAGLVKVDVQFVRMMKRYITLAELKTHYQAHKTTGGPLKNMALFTRQRLSIQPLTREEFDFILSLEEKEPS
ncbi:thymocyte nuclear protein 1 isoform X5 [Zalophus californianus]|uniref:Thymocyte nuclear protein 1 n=1 Tax=Zalophus californianus TaxID=9704 RepID=A0A6J2BTN9_ZALCA|nr:thymocyte nuclear protein 1 isoform X5 [Zalophus californianus]XP_027976578.1 thymocyte nuclear protein 1 isoform X3 [Eumetopias jubatus]